MTGDGVVDQYIDALSFNFDTATNGPCATPSSPTCNRGQGAAYLFNGATGALIRRTDDPVPEAGAQWGAHDAEPLGDVDGDGRPDYYVNAPLQAGPSGEPGGGRSWVFSGATGTVLYEIKDPTPSEGGSFGFSMTRTDYNKDGMPDLYVGQNPHHLAGGAVDTSGGTYVFDGRDGSLLKSLELPPSDAQPGAEGNLGSVLGWTIIAPGDLNGDGEPDYVAGAPTTDVGPSAFNCQAPTPGCVKDVGREYFFLSKVPTTPRRPTRPPTPAAPGIARFAGCPSLTANVIRGSAAGGPITGTVGGDRIFGGTGNDVVDGLAGDDCIDLGPGTDRGQGGLGGDLLLGGLGDDRLVGNSGNDRIRGGSSTDRINGGLGNDRLHGQSGADRVNGERGRDRINGGSSNDVISAGSSGDRVAGDQGGDRINGNSGNDTLRGNSGHDRITGSTGADRISGGGGNDRINSRDGRRDRVNCGRGRDTVIADRVDVITGGCERARRA
jgi:Ca2+-binding RTX toxin-like protein